MKKSYFKCNSEGGDVTGQCVCIAILSGISDSDRW